MATITMLYRNQMNEPNPTVARMEKLLEKKAAEMTKREAALAQELEALRTEKSCPVELPTPEQYKKAKDSYAYEPGKVHLAIAGSSGTGKSSMINAIRGMRDVGADAAQVGIIETTSQMQRFHEPDDRLPFVWFDVPGAGTLNVPGSTYFKDKGLYLLDSIIVLYNDRFTNIDIAIIQNCLCYNIPYYIVRSKSDHHIQNVAMATMVATDDEEPSEADIRRAKADYMSQTRENLQNNLRNAGLPMNSKLYLISNRCLRSLMMAKKAGRPTSSLRSPFMLDEENLLDDLLLDATARRSPRSYQSVTSGEVRDNIRSLVNEHRSKLRE
ncbi:hypothetical protein V5O48_009699 [Marasmius crinis-equi]|uniref:IRG-type G domain-containing protein n=1 Tax=Marasmius crinis-equi TaxID=585013 RepID=A0ABR3FAS6_9AGAR